MYIPPDGDKVDFNLEIFDPPAGDGADFQLLEDESIVRVNAHVSLNLSTKAQAEARGFTRITELKMVDGTWICPASVKKARIECWGGGGGGVNKRGGGGGAYARDNIAVTPGELYTYTVAKAVTGTFDGEDTYWEDGLDIKANGGKGVHSGGSLIGRGGRGGKGRVIYPGGDGDYLYGSPYGAGGGAAGSFGPGKHASGGVAGAAMIEYGGAGGESGGSGKYYGGGGGGRKSSSPFTSGPGAPGLIRISYVPQMEAEVSARKSLILGARAEAEAKSLAANRSYTDMFGIIRSRKR